MVDWVNYVGFPDNPLYPMAQRYLGVERCSLLTFGVKGGYEGGRKCFNAFQVCLNAWLTWATPNRCRATRLLPRTGS